MVGRLTGTEMLPRDAARGVSLCGWRGLEKFAALLTEISKSSSLQSVPLGHYNARYFRNACGAPSVNGLSLDFSSSRDLKVVGPISAWGSGPVESA